MDPSGWFEVQEIDGDTWAVSEPHHPERSHFYVLRDRGEDGIERGLLIDTGLGVLPIRPMVDRLVSGPVEVALTHTHWDHIGGLGEYPRFAVHEEEADLHHPPFPLDEETLRACVLEEDATLPDGFDPSAYRAYQGPAARLLRDGDAVRVGARELEVIHAPGHSPGSVCYFERARGYLFTGDVAYGAAIYLQLHSCDPAAYEASVRRIAALPGVKRILPGHDSLDEPATLPSSIVCAIAVLKQRGSYHQGAGRFDFDGFSIVL